MDSLTIQYNCKWKCEHWSTPILTLTTDCRYSRLGDENFGPTITYAHAPTCYYVRAHITYLSQYYCSSSHRNTKNYDILCIVHFRFILDFLEFDKIVYVFADQIIKDHACCKMKQIVKYVIIVKIEPVAEGGKIL